MSMYQLESAASLRLLEKAEAVLKEEHKVPQSSLNQQLALVLRTRVERAIADKNKDLAATTLKQLQDLSDANSADGMIATAFHAAQGAQAIVAGDFADAVNQLEEEDSNAISMRSLI